MKVKLQPIQDRKVSDVEIQHVSHTCVNGAVELHRHVDARRSIGGDIHGQILFALCWREEQSEIGRHVENDRTSQEHGTLTKTHRARC